jgi:dUTP pyrophosphatase
MVKEILIKKISPDVNLPSFKSDGASGLDLEAHLQNEIIIKPGKYTLVPTGIALLMPEKCEAQIRPRSGLAAKNGITVLNTPGTIDSDYRGEIKVILINFGDKEFVIKNKDRIAQMVFTTIEKPSLRLASKLTETKRNTGGFGSTGK